jgi:hypothetical protein
VDLIRPAALPLEAAIRLNYGMISADDPEATFEIPKKCQRLSRKDA